MDRPDRIATLQFVTERGEGLAQTLKLVGRGWLMDPVHDRRALAFKALGRGDVGGDHEFLDQPMAVEARSRLDRGDLAVFAQRYLQFRKIEVQRAALVAAARQRFIRPVQRPDNGFEQRFRQVVRRSVPGLLNLFIGQARCGTHQAA